MHNVQIHRIAVLVAILAIAPLIVSPTLNEPHVQIYHQKKDTALDLLKESFTDFIGGFSEYLGPGNVRYYLQGNDMSVGFAPQKIQFLHHSGMATLQLVGSNEVSPEAEHPSGVTKTVFSGSADPIISQYFQSLVYHNIYDHIDLHYFLQDGQLKYEFFVYPGGEVSDIQLQWQGPVTLHQGPDGVEIHLSGSSLFTDTNPVTYNTVDRSREVESSFVFYSSTSYGFEVAQYDPTRLLIIDPTIEMGTYISTDDDDKIYAMALDSDNNIYVTGYTNSPNFPVTMGSYDETPDALSYTNDAYILKLAPDGATVIYATYISGSSSEYGRGLAVDADGNAFLTGYTLSTDFPTTAGAFSTSKTGDDDVYVLKLAANGSALLFSTYVGGTLEDNANGLAIDSDNATYVTGITRSTDFPTTSGAFDQSGASDTLSNGFVFKLSADGGSLVYSTYIEGSSYDTPKAIKVDGSGHAYITGITYSSDFPTTSGSWSQYLSGYTDAFVTKLETDGSSLVFSTFISLLSSTDDAYDLELDPDNNIYIIGNTFRELTSVMRLSVIRLAANGSTYLQSTYMEANASMYGKAAVIDPNGDLFVLAETTATDVATTSDAFNSSNYGQTDIVLLKYSSDLSVLNYSSYLGGASHDVPTGILLTTQGDLVISGYTQSTNFPVTGGAYNTTGDGSANYDGFVSIISMGPNTYPPVVINPPSDISYNVGETGHTITWKAGDADPSSYNITRNGALITAPVESWAGGEISRNVDGLDVGTYTFVITLVDMLGNSVQDTVVVTVTVAPDTTPPVISSPSDISYESGSTGNSISWTVSDPEPGTYNITLDGVLITAASVNWSTGSIMWDVDGLAVGTYTFIITAGDATGNIAQDTVIVVVIDTTPPELSTPSDVVYEVDSTGYTISWVVGDINPGTYNITRDGQLVTSAAVSWFNGSIELSIDGLSAGDHTYIITLLDESGNWNQDTVVVTVMISPDLTSPDLSSPADVSYAFGTVGHEIIWIIGDTNPGMYNVTRNGTLVTSLENWNNGSVIVNIDNLGVGRYVFVITVVDGAHNLVQDEVVVNVLPGPDLVAPEVSSPADISYEVGSSGNTLSWVVGDRNPGIYNVTINGTTYLGNTVWSNGTIEVNVDGLQIGTHVLTLWIQDQSGNLASDTVLIEVLDLPNSSSSQTTSGSPTTSTTPSSLPTSQSDTQETPGFVILMFMISLLVLNLVSPRRR